MQATTVQPSTMQARLRAVSRRMGLPGWLGLGLCAISLWAVLDWLPLEREALAEQQEQVAHTRRQLQSQTPTAPGDRVAGDAAGEAAALAEAGQAWARVWGGLPARARATELQAAVLASARQHGVAVASVQYSGAPARGLPSLWRQQLVLPVEAGYPALRAWLGVLLSEPALSLDALEISRADPMADAVKARVAVSLWWREEPR